MGDIATGCIDDRTFDGDIDDVEDDMGLPILDIFGTDVLGDIDVVGVVDDEGVSTVNSLVGRGDVGGPVMLDDLVYGSPESG